MCRPLACARLLVGVVVQALVLATLGSNPVAAKGEDVCPEPNDTFQAACFLGDGSDALGFISRPDDVDAYRFETHDFGASVHLALPDRPNPYRLSLVSYNGDVMASTQDAAIDATLDLPGTYYAFVDSADGRFADGAPYRITASVSYPGGAAPSVVYSHEFAPNAPDTFTSVNGVSGVKQFSDENGIYTLGEGHLSLQMTRSGAADLPIGMLFSLLPDPKHPEQPNPVPSLDDFTLTIDSRMLTPADAGYIIEFRVVDPNNFYEIIVKLRPREVTIAKYVNGTSVRLTNPTRIVAVSPTGVNRNVIRCVGNEIRVNVNGQDVGHARDDTFQRGVIGYGAGTWGDPTTIDFDNILVTTPTSR